MKKYLTNPAVLWVALLGSAVGQLCFWEYFAPSLTTVGGPGGTVGIVGIGLPSNAVADVVWDWLPDSVLQWLLEYMLEWVPYGCGAAAVLGALNGIFVGSLLVWGAGKWPWKGDEAARYAQNLARSQREPEWKRCLKRPAVLWWAILGSVVGPVLFGFYEYGF